MLQDRRRKLWVVDKLQSVLARRLLAYWFATWMSILALTLLATYFCSIFYPLERIELSIWTLTKQLLGQFWLPILVSILVMPIILRDYMRVSHRFAGPMLRFRRAIQQVVAGQDVPPIQLRKDDYWQEFADDFNRLLSFVQANQEGVKQVDSDNEDGVRAEAAEAESDLAAV